MKNARFFLFLATFMVALTAACGGNPPPSDERDWTTARFELAYAFPGAPSGEVLINDIPTGTMMTLDGSPTMIETPRGISFRLTVEGRARDGSPIRFFMIDNVMALGDLLTHRQTYYNFGGYWSDLNRPNANPKLLEMIWSITSRLPNEKGYCQGTDVAFTGMEWGLTCVHPEGFFTYCSSGTDFDHDGVPDFPSTRGCERVVAGKTLIDAQGFKTEEFTLHSWLVSYMFDVLNGTIDRSETFEHRHRRVIHPWE